MSPEVRSLSSVRARARARRRSGGAAMFIVAVTLGLLAAMGVYGLTATAEDVRAAGHIRQATQAQHAAEHAVILTAETLTPSTAGEVVRSMQMPPDADPTKSARKTNTDCKTAKPYTGDATYQIAEACAVLTLKEMANIADKTNKWTGDPYSLKLSDPAQNRSFGEVMTYPFARVEMTNPINWTMPAGYSSGGPNGASLIFTQVRATVFVDMKTNMGTAAASLDTPSQSVAAGRGRLVVGPYIQ
jgi:Tfp pilus assembly protein PilX